MYLSPLEAKKKSSLWALNEEEEEEEEKEKGRDGKPTPSCS